MAVAFHEACVRVLSRRDGCRHPLKLGCHSSWAGPLVPTPVAPALTKCRELVASPDVDGVRDPRRAAPSGAAGLLLGRLDESPVRGLMAMRARRERLALTQCDLLGVAVVLVDA